MSEGEAGADAAPTIDTRQLRSALEYAVLMAQEGAKLRPPLDSPKDLRRFFDVRRVPNAGLKKIRRLVEGDEAFRSRIAAGAIPELVDEVGRLWLARPTGWEAQIEALLAEADEAEHEADLRRALRREEKRRQAAEQAAARVASEVAAARADAAALRDELQEARRRAEELERSLVEVRGELSTSRVDARHERDRLRAALERAERSGAEADAVAPPPTAEPSPDDPRDDEIARLAAEAHELRATLDAGRRALLALADDLTPTVPPSPDATETAVPRRVPLDLPGGVLGRSAEAALHLVRSGAVVLVDGYNVTKTVWDDRSLAEQRAELIARVEDLALRHGAELTVVFDGAAIDGAHSDGRRHVRVVYSPPGESADDVIRAEVARLPASRPAVVVTSDAEIVRDVRRLGANTVPSTAFVALL